MQFFGEMAAPEARLFELVIEDPNSTTVKSTGYLLYVSALFSSERERYLVLRGLTGYHVMFPQRVCTCLTTSLTGSVRVPLPTRR